MLADFANRCSAKFTDLSVKNLAGKHDVLGRRRPIAPGPRCQREPASSPARKQPPGGDSREEKCVDDRLEGVSEGKADTRDAVGGRLNDQRRQKDCACDDHGRLDRGNDKQREKEKVGRAPDAASVAPAVSASGVFPAELGWHPAFAQERALGEDIVAKATCHLHVRVSQANRPVLEREGDGAFSEFA